MGTELTSIPPAAIESERDYLRKLMAEYAKETSDLEKYALAVAGVIWSWSVTNPVASGIKPLFFLPVLTTFLFGIRALSVYRVRASIRVYLDELQRLAGIPASFGWEHYVIEHGHALRVRTAKAYWAILQIGSIVIGVIAYLHLP